MLAERVKGISDRHKKITMLIIALFFTLFRGLRWETGTDWEQFHDFFYNASLSGLFSPRYATGSVVMEPGYTLLNVFFSNLTGSYTSLLIFYNAIMFGIYYSCSWKYFPKSPISVFICLIFFTVNPFPLRQGLACAIFLYGIRYILSKDMLKFGIAIIIAASIHNSAILLFPCYFFLNKQIPNKLIVISYIVCLIFAESQLLNLVLEQTISIFAKIIGADSSFLLKAYTYLNHNKDVDSGLFTKIFSFLRSIVFLSIFCLFASRNKVPSNYNIFFNCFALSLCIGILFKYQMQEIARVQDYFVPGTALLLGYILSVLPTNKHNIFYVFVILYSFYAVYKYFDKWYDYLVPYKSIIGV
ncbi:MAG: EpsG family protein [Fibromonadaceae bacterium]|nr:EpsG family protein [Fibromonadaceae bacterium]